MFHSVNYLLIEFGYKDKSIKRKEKLEIQILAVFVIFLVGGSLALGASNAGFVPCLLELASSTVIVIHPGFESCSQINRVSATQDYQTNLGEAFLAACCLRDSKFRLGGTDRTHACLQTK